MIRPELLRGRQGVAKPPGNIIRVAMLKIAMRSAEGDALFVAIAGPGNSYRHLR